MNGIMIWPALVFYNCYKENKMLNIKMMRACTWFDDKRERGFVVVSANSVLEFSFNKLRRPYVEYDFKHGYYVLVNTGFFNIGLTDKG